MEGIAEEIEAFKDVLARVKESKPEPKRRFECSHSAALRQSQKRP
jgi:hypothetical protein